MAKNRETIAMDLDMCLGDYAPLFCRISNAQFGTHLTPREYSEDWPTLWGGVDAAEVARRTAIINQRQFEPGRDMRAIREAGPVCAELAKDWDLVVATSRPLDIMRPTRAWIDRNYPDIFKDVFSTGTWADKSLTKGEVLMEKGIRYLEDDQLRHVVGMSAVGGTGVLYGNYTWSQNLDCGDSPIVIARTWEAVRNYFQAVRRREE